MKIIEFKRRKIFEKVDEGMFSDAIIKYRAAPWICEQKAHLFLTHTYRHNLRIDLFFADIWLEWETKRKSLNKNFISLMPTNGAFYGIDMATGADYTVLENHLENCRIDRKARKEGITLDQNTIGPIFKEAAKKIRNISRNLKHGYIGEFEGFEIYKPGQSLMDKAPGLAAMKIEVRGESEFEITKIEINKNEK